MPRQDDSQEKTLSLSGFTIDLPLLEVPGHRLYRGTREKDQRAVLVKTGPPGEDADRLARRLRRELVVLQQVGPPSVPQALSVEREGDHVALIMEDKGALPLSSLLDDKPQSFLQSIVFARRLVEALNRIHEAGLIHKQLRPENILFDPRTRALQFMGLEESCPFPAERVPLVHPAGLPGNPAYYAPEQTGRSSREVDYRTDYYSLGVVLWRVVMGRLPFVADDPVKLVSQILTAELPSPRNLRRDIPPMLEALLLKLLEKDPDRRYFTASGLITDLDRIKEILDSGKLDRGFKLGADDMTPSLPLPGRLYEREDPAKTLRAALKETRAGKRRMVLLRGDAGTGKTRVARELLPQITAAGAYFAMGQFDQQTSNAPYEALSMALGDVVRQILSEPQSRQQAWKERLEEELGDNRAIVADLVPGLDALLDPGEPVPLTGPAQARERFNAVCIKFLRVLATKEHPLVLFLDNLQWMDHATREFLPLALEHPLVEHLLVIGAIRQEDWGAEHPLAKCLEQISRNAPDTGIEQIQLEPLSPAAIRELVRDTLEPNPELRGGSDEADVTSRELTNLITVATRGNPFFVQEYLRHLHTRRRLVLTVKGGKAEWRLDNLQSSDAIQEVEQLLRRRLRDLPEPEQDLLQEAAGIGQRVDLATLVYTSARSREEVEEHLTGPVTRGYLVYAGERLLHNALSEEERKFGGNSSPIFEFRQNLVQHACYNLVDDNQKQQRHLRIGRLFMRDLNAQESGAAIYRALKHLNASREMIVEASENVSLTELNLSAATRAKGQMAPGVALDYARRAFQAVEPDWWNTRYKLTLAMHRERAELEYLRGDLEAAEKTVRETLPHARNNEDRAQLYTLRVVQLSARGERVKALRAGAEGLSRLGLRLPLPKLEKQPKPDGDSRFQRKTQQEFMACRMKLGNKRLEQLGRLSTAGDPEKRARLELLCAMMEPAYYLHRDLWLLVGARVVNYSLAQGLIAEAAPAFLAQGVMTSETREDYRQAFELGVFAERLTRKLNNPAVQAQTSHFLGSRLHPWARPLRDLEEILETGFQAGLRSGEGHYSIQTLLDLALLQLYLGRPGAIAGITRRLRDFCAIRGRPVPLLARGLDLIAEELSGNSEIPPNRQADPKLDRKNGGKNADDPFQQYLNDCLEAGDRPALAHYLVLRGASLAILGYDAAARKHLGEAQPFLRAVRGTMTQAFHAIFDAVTLTEIHRDAGFRERPKIRATVEDHLRQLKEWAQGCPQNFQHLQLIAAACSARIQEQPLAALENLEHAALHAQENELPHLEGYAAELAAQACQRRGNQLMAAAYAKHARRAYQNWQVPQKLRDFDQTYGELLNELNEGRTSRKRVL